MVDKTLGREAAKEPLDYTLLQVQVDHVLIHCARVFEYDRAHGRCAAPLPESLVPFPRRPEGVHRVGPGGIGGSERRCEQQCGEEGECPSIHGRSVPDERKFFGFDEAPCSPR